MASGIAARRHQPSLPAFQLPNNRGGYTSLGSVLTPPALTSGDQTIPMTTMGSSTSSNLAAAPSGFSSTQNYWTAPNPTYTYGSAPNAPQSFTSSGLGQTTSLAYRNPYSPSGNGSMNRTGSRPSSPSTNNLVGTQTYEPSPHFTASSGLPSVGQTGMHNHYSGGYPVSSGPSHSPITPQSQASHDLYSTHSSLPPPTPSHSYYSQSSPYSNSPTTSQMLSMSSSQPQPSITRTLTSPSYPYHPPIHPAPSHHGLPRYNSLGHMGSMPVHYPAMVGGLHTGTIQHQERPFKCDQCPQSFNRNHDLKRHKRIHLAVKPFPCDNCEKSFSRKDALKVIIPKPMSL